MQNRRLISTACAVALLAAPLAVAGTAFGTADEAADIASTMVAIN